MMVVWNYTINFDATEIAMWDNLSENEVFVFGSNLAGRHGKGAALTAKLRYGATYGVGVGHQGNSYAIPTKDAHLNTLPLAAIEQHVAEFIGYAKSNEHLTFYITPVGCGPADYKKEQIAPMFTDIPDNCVLPCEWS